jgi:hypothetical protein
MNLKQMLDDQERNNQFLSEKIETLIKNIEKDRKLTISTTKITENKEIEKIIHKGENKIYDEINKLIQQFKKELLGDNK